MRIGAQRIDPIQRPPVRHPRMSDASSWSLAPRRSGSRRSMPRAAYRHRNQVPSAVTRLRSQVRQNGAVTEAMMPNVVPSASRNRSAGARPSPEIGSIGP